MNTDVQWPYTTDPKYRHAMADIKLDQIVKGAPPSSKDISPSTDPLASLPSSPPQIYLNLLILEASLRSQYLELRARRRQHTFFLTLLGLWIIYFSYALFLAPREDGSGVGGSVYWVVEVTEKVALMGGVVTALLVWGTGQWERGIRWPRRWVGVTNRGLRGFNCKLVVVKGVWWHEYFDTLVFFLNGGLFKGSGGSTYRFIDPNVLSDAEKQAGLRSHLPNIHEEDMPTSRRRGYEEDLAPGGDTISLLLLPKPFSPTFRENWDVYRSEYWERENERRRILSIKLQAHDKALLKKQRAQEGWFASLKFWRRPARPLGHLHSHSHSHSHSLSHSNSLTNKHLTSTTITEKRLRSGSRSDRSGSHSRQSSRATTPSPETDEASFRPGHVRRSSTASTASAASSSVTVEKRKKRNSTLSPSNTMTSSTSSSSSAAAARIPKYAGAALGGGSRASTPGAESDGEGRDVERDGERDRRTPGSPLVRESSFTSVSSLDMEKEESVGRDGENLRAKNGSVSSRRTESIAGGKADNS